MPHQWADATRWLSQYGSIALFVLMALPLPVPKVPSLAFAGIYRLPIYEVLLAIGAGSGHWQAATQLPPGKSS